MTEITIGKAKPRKAKKPSSKEAAPVAEEAVEKKAAPEAPVVEAPAPEAPAAEVEPTAAPEINITDAARKLAEEHGIDLAGLEGSGAGGRILKGDVEKAIRAQADEE